MMKIVTISILTMFTCFTSGQSFDSLGADHNPELNAHEAAFLNQEFKTLNSPFEFSEKKIAFVTGSSGTRFMSKKEYFNQVMDWKSINSSVTQSLVIFTPEEKLKSGGYDALITVWVKLLRLEEERKQLTF